jgi:DNA-binding protein H-NS
VNIEDALNESFKELGINFDDNPDYIQTGTGENAGDTDVEDEASDDEAVDEADTEEDEDGESEETTPSADVVEVPEGAVLRLPDGTEVDVDKAVLLQSDYTKKTQQVAEERKNLDREREELEQDRSKVAETYQQMRDWYDQRSADPTAWVQEIVSSSPDPTATIAKALYELAHNGKLDPAFVQTFGIDAGEIAERATQSKQSRELEELRSKVEQRERAEQEQARIKEMAARYQSEWEQIKQANSLAFDGPEAEVEAKRQLFNFATEKRMTHSLTDAYELLRLKSGVASQPPAPQSPTTDGQVTKKKRASRAITPKSEVAGNGNVRKPLTTRSAAIQALDEFATRA